MKKSGIQLRFYTFLSLSFMGRNMFCSAYWSVKRWTARLCKVSKGERCLHKEQDVFCETQMPLLDTNSKNLVVTIFFGSHTLHAVQYMYM